jgi:hypothetical protein
MDTKDLPDIRYDGATSALPEVLNAHLSHQKCLGMSIAPG